MVSSSKTPVLAMFPERVSGFLNRGSEVRVLPGALDLRIAGRPVCNGFGTVRAPSGFRRHPDGGPGKNAVLGIGHCTLIAHRRASEPMPRPGGGSMW